MQALQDDCARSKKRVQELESELEHCKAEARDIAREGEDNRVREVDEWRLRYESVKREKEGGFAGATYVVPIRLIAGAVRLTHTSA